MKIFFLIELSETELHSINGGSFPMLLIRLFVPTIEGILSFKEGLRDGYDRTTQH